ncbi:MAG TPA: SDR family oxidoreductase [Abditibacteriaceae bacterium]
MTGATGDLGRVIAETLALCGAEVAIHYHSNVTKAEELRRQIESLQRRAAIFPADITRKDDVFQMRDAIASTLGPPQIVVSNAVIQYQWTSVLEQATEDYESQFRSCVLQVVNLAQAFVPAMQSRQAGRFIGINTECALQCQPNQSAYVAGKRGMDGVLRVLAREVGPDGVTVNQVAPGWMISERDRSAGTEKQPGYEQNVPLRRRGHDQDIANAVAFLASDLAGFISGALLPVCGGNVMPAL